MKAAIVAASLMPFSRSTPLLTSTAQGLDAPDGLGDIVRREPSGQHDRQRQTRWDQVPVEQAARSTVAAVHESIQQQALSRAMTAGVL